MPKAMAETRCDVDAAGERLVAADHDGASERAEPGVVKVEIDRRHRDGADRGAEHPGAGQALAEEDDRAGAEDAAGDGSLGGAEGDRGQGLDDLRQAEEQDDRQHFGVAREQQARHDEVVDRQADQEEHGEHRDGGEQRVEAEQVEQEIRGESAQHQEVAMREIDDLHDAEDQVEPEPDQGEIEAEHQPRAESAEQHVRSGQRGARRVVTCR